MQSTTALGTRQTAVIPMIDKSVRVFTRIGAVRGIAGAWKEEAPTFTPTDTVVGQSHSVMITANDYRDLQFPITPTTLLQKLVRTTELFSTTHSAQVEYTTLYDLASTNPMMLATYLKGAPTQTAPIAVAIATPIIEAVEAVAPAPIQEVVEPSLPLETEIYPVESEPTMSMNFQATVLNHDDDAVLVVPEVKPYFSRTVDGISEEEIYDYARRTQQNVLLTGDAGTGKTSSARNYAAIKKLPFVTIECTQQIDQSITQGRFVPTGVGNSVQWKYSQLVTAIRQPSVILINELTRMTPKAASLFLRLLEERELVVEPLNEVVKVHPDVLFIADQNTGIGYTGTSKQDNALVDRFNIKVEFHYDTKIESQFIKSPALLEFASAIRQASETNDEFSVPLSTRALINFQAQAQNLGFVFAVNALMNNYPKSDGEREAIKMRFDADAITIATELGVDYANYSA
jgi:hypothetical protein